MAMHFEGETLNIAGREYPGTVVIEAEVSNASFDHEFGTEHAIDIDYIPDGFIADGVSRCLAETLAEEAYRSRALDAWLAANLSRVEKRFEMECKRSAYP